jgi:hypothetical protein
MGTGNSHRPIWGSLEEDSGALAVSHPGGYRSIAGNRAPSSFSFMVGTESPEFCGSWGAWCVSRYLSFQRNLATSGGRLATIPPGNGVKPVHSCGARGFFPRISPVRSSRRSLLIWVAMQMARARFNVHAAGKAIVKSNAGNTAGLISST